MVARDIQWPMDGLVNHGPQMDWYGPWLLTDVTRCHVLTRHGLSMWPRHWLRMAHTGGCALVLQGMGWSHTLNGMPIRHATSLTFKYRIESCARGTPLASLLLLLCVLMALL